VEDKQVRSVAQEKLIAEGSHKDALSDWATPGYHRRWRWPITPGSRPRTPDDMSFVYT